MLYLFVKPEKDEMNNMTDRDLFEACRESDAPLSVMNVAGSAADNAADIIGWMNRYDASGRATREFVEAWYKSVISILSERDCHEQSAAEWFAVRGCRA